jgi:Bacterial RNA polymerase, alpha chain C terminal domain
MISERLEHQAAALRCILDDKALSMTIEDLELSYRSYSCLQRLYIDTVRDLVEKTEADLLKNRNFGKKSLKEIKETLRGLGLSLRAPKKLPRIPSSETRVLRAAGRLVDELLSDNPPTLTEGEGELVRAVREWREKPRRHTK